MAEFLFRFLLHLRP